MASVVVNGDTSGAVTLTAPAVAGTVTVTLPSTSGTMLTTASTAVITQAMLSTNVAGNGPAFSAYQSTLQTMANVVSTKLLFQTEEFDTANAFTNSTFTAPIAGYYEFSAAVEMTAAPAAFTLTFAKNGSLVKRVAYAGGDTAISGVCLIYLAVNDYVEAYALVTGTPNTLANQSTTWFTGFLARTA